MSLPARPDSSYSNIRLTRSNYNPSGHLLSTFNKDKDNGGADVEQSRVERPEPAIDDAPIGSSDEEEEAGDEKELDSDIDFGDTRKRKLSTCYKPTGNGSNGLELESSQGKRTRPSSSMESDGEDDKSDLFDLWGSSQQSKRRKSSQFANRSRSFNKPPSSSAPSSSQNSKPEPKSKKGKKKNKKSEFKMPRDIDVSSPPRKTRASKSSTFKNLPLPGDLDDLLSEDDGSPLSSPDDSCSTPSSIFDLASSQTKPSLCPMCKEEVDPEALTNFQVQTKNLFRDQMAFCDSHQAATAENERKSKGYPIVDWDTFDERVKNHFDDLEKLLVPGSSSYYRDILDSDLKTGKAKNFRLTLSGGGLENISCGYYGTRGSGKMLQAVTAHFGRKLGRLATVDHIVKTAGVATYAQAVLVPALAVHLVKEDMNVDDESARQILRDSIGIGEKLNAQQNDTVPIPKEVEDEQKENMETGEHAYIEKP